MQVTYFSEKKLDFCLHIRPLFRVQMNNDFPVRNLEPAAFFPYDQMVANDTPDLNTESMIPIKNIFMMVAVPP